jgi:hypothetical protein
MFDQQHHTLCLDTSMLKWVEPNWDWHPASALTATVLCGATAMADDINTPAEEWRAISNHDGYEVSTMGRVRSIDRIVPCKLKDGTFSTRKRKGQILALIPGGSNGQYRFVSLGAGYIRYVHRLVAITFLGEPPSPKHEAAHKNGVASDNRLTNLKWATKSENEQDKREHGTYFTRPIISGERHYSTKLTDEIVSQIRASYTGEFGQRAEMAKSYGVSWAIINHILTKKTWKHLP